MIFLERKDLVAWLESLIEDRTLVAPRNMEGVILYRTVDHPEQIAWDFTRPELSAKEVFFPPTERMFTIHKNGDDVHLSETLPEDEQVVFGVRPCDARGMKVMDALFIDSQPVDPYYARRRERTTLIGMACQRMEPTCFCTDVGGAPDDDRHVDLMINELDGGYSIKVISPKGQRLMDVGLKTVDLGKFSPDIQSFAGNNVQQSTFSKVESVDWPATFDDEFWMEMSERCIGCRICAYVCPTCRCFDVRDEALPTQDGYERLRCWDSCAREAYRSIAGGHNPRAVKGERLRNRFLCKFHYFSQQYGLNAPMVCTGCGRCVDACPVNIDITEVLCHLVGMQVPSENLA